MRVILYLGVGLAIALLGIDFWESRRANLSKRSVKRGVMTLAVVGSTAVAGQGARALMGIFAGETRVGSCEVEAVALVATVLAVLLAGRLLLTYARTVSRKLNRAFVSPLV